jgi:hypothetical protein
VFIILFKFHHSLIVHLLRSLDTQLLVLLLTSIILLDFLHLSIDLHFVTFIGLVVDVKFQVAFQDAAVVGNVPFVATIHKD